MFWLPQAQQQWGSGYCLSVEGTGLVKFTTVALSKHRACTGCRQWQAALLVFVSNVLFMLLFGVKVFIDPDGISQAKQNQCGFGKDLFWYWEAGGRVMMTTKAQKNSMEQADFEILIWRTLAFQRSTDALWRYGAIIPATLEAEAIWFQG